MRGTKHTTAGEVPAVSHTDVLLLASRIPLPTNVANQWTSDTDCLEEERRRDCANQ